MATQAHAVGMDNSLKVHVERRGNKYIWELRRDGVAGPVKYSVPIYPSADTARTSGDVARQEYSARLAARLAKRERSSGPTANANHEAEPGGEVAHGVKFDGSD